MGTDRQGIGYSGIGYRTSDVRAVPLAKTENDKLVEPTFENALNKTYPLGRTLYVYVAKKPGEPLPPVVKEFLKFVLSKQGQEIVVKDGFGQLPDKTIEKNVKALDSTRVARSDRVVQIALYDWPTSLSQSARTVPRSKRN